MAYGARMETYIDVSGYYRWRLIAANGEKVASSGEAFSSEWNAKRSAQTVIDICKGL